MFVEIACLEPVFGLLVLLVLFVLFEPKGKLDKGEMRPKPPPLAVFSGRLCTGAALLRAEPKNSKNCVSHPGPGAVAIRTVAIRSCPHRHPGVSSFLGFKVELNMPVAG
jgi:hypothetical protein